MYKIFLGVALLLSSITSFAAENGSVHFNHKIEYYWSGVDDCHESGESYANSYQECTEFAIQIQAATGMTAKNVRIEDTHHGYGPWPYDGEYCYAWGSVNCKFELE